MGTSVDCKGRPGVGWGRKTIASWARFSRKAARMPLSTAVRAKAFSVWTKDFQPAPWSAQANAAKMAKLKKP